MSFIRSENPIWFFNNLIGQPLDDTYFMFFLQNTLPYLPATVYQDPNGNTPWINPIEFTPAGLLPDNIYFDSTITYRLEVRQGNTQADPLIWLVENYVPGTGGITPIQTSAVSTDNLITNPQFALVNFTGSFTTTASTINIAPGWQVIGNGSAGSITFTQIAIAGASQIVTNPPYALQIISSGWTSITLQQTFNGNGGLWTSDTAEPFGGVAVNFTALSATPINISATIVYSDGPQQAVIIDSALLTNAYAEYVGAQTIAPSINPDIPPNASTSLQITWSSPSTVTITSIQLVGQDVPTDMPYLQEPIEREIDYTFHLYNDALQFKPIPSLLTGWDFSLNPAQFGSTQSITTVPSYIWDQTICGSAMNTISVVRNALNGGFQATTTVDNDAFYMLQYLTGQSAFNTTINKLSVNLRAYQLTNPNVVAQVYLYFSNGGGTIPTLPTTIGTLASSGVFTRTASDWAIIPQDIGVATIFEFGSPLAQVVDYKSTGWQGYQFASLTTTANFAIVVTFKIPTSGTSVVVNSISCDEGNIPTIPAPQTPDEVLRECQYYYEKSYNPLVIPGTADFSNCIVARQGIFGQASTTASIFSAEFNVNYSQKRTVAPTITLYNPAATNDTTNVVVSIQYPGIADASAPVLQTNWTQFILGSKTAGYKTNNVAALLSSSGSNYSAAVDGIVEFHYTCDARLGRVA